MLHRHVQVRDDIRPIDAPEALSLQDDAHRVLVAGSGITTGWGVSTHGLALCGALQRTLQWRLGEPVDVEQRSRIGALLSDAPAILAEDLHRRWDAIVLAFGWSDAIALTRTTLWSSALDAVLRLVGPGTGTPVVLVGLPPMNTLGITGVLGSVITRHGQALDAVSCSAANTRPGVSFVPLAAAENRAARPTGSPEAYHAWAQPIAGAVASALAPDPARAGAGRTAAGTTDPSDPRHGQAARPIYRHAAVASLPLALRHALRDVETRSPILVPTEVTS